MKRRSDNPFAEFVGPAAAHGAAVIAAGAELDVVLGAMLALWAPLHGHSCVDLENVPDDLAAAAEEPGDEGGRDAGKDDRDLTAEVAALPWPAADRWRAELVASPLVRVVDDGWHLDDPGSAEPVLDDRPLVLHGTLLYTQRQWVDECTVAGRLRALAASDRLSVIVGGPGTGKTYTAGQRVAAEREGVAVEVGLAAPTGKAAARLTAAVAEHSTDVDLQAVTLHRLLGPRADHRTRFRHHANNPLPHELVVVDETSMVPLPMMARLVDAIAADGSLVLVGDPDQLESIEVGAVLGDVVRAAGTDGSPLADAVTRLTHRHRTAAASPIAILADAIRDQDPDAAMRVLRASQKAADSPDTSIVRFVEVDADPVSAADAVRRAVEPAYRAAVEAASRGDPEAALAAIESARVLCAHRRGPFGVDTWNGHVASWLFGDGSLRAHAGRPLLATRNDPRTGIVNGDTGVTVRTEHGALRAAFRRGAGIRQFAPAELDDPETAYATTVHKTQGSEYDTVVLVHPPAGSPLVGRELLYTAVTRAKRNLVVVGSEESIGLAITTPARRVTGLAGLLAQPPR